MEPTSAGENSGKKICHVASHTWVRLAAMKSFHALTFTAFAALALGGAACSRSGEAAKAVAAVPAAKISLPVLGPAPGWSLKDVNGQTVSSDQFKGKVVVVDFWATWCGPCRMEIPGYIELQKKYGQDGFAIIGVSLDQAGPDVVRQFAEKFGVNYQMVMGDEAVQAAFGGMEAIPTTFLIDRAGQVRDRKVGAEPAAAYERKVAALLN
ncbi:MAG: TlpA family protein disulfide reductase [Opitutus sp.]|nr:TlpA family protein disulfide reductase [Opitutus sp.]